MCQQCDDLNHLFDNNRAWIARMNETDPDFFDTLTRTHAPEYLWIGCSDARVPANQIVGLQPGEVFVHRNIANLINSSDMNVLTVIEYAVETLQVKHIMVTGHYCCGGIKAAMEDHMPDLVSHWVRPIRKYHLRHQAELDGLPFEQKWDRLCEINVMEQVRNLCHIPVVRNAWARGQSLQLHGLIYDVRDGLIRDLGVSICSAEQADALLMKRV